MSFISSAAVLFLLFSLSSQSSHECYCSGDPYIDWWPRSANISLKGTAYFEFYEYRYSVYDVHGCHDLEVRWEILRRDGLTELYTIINETYNHGRDLELQDSGLFIYGPHIFWLESELTITPTDLRYDGAQLRAVLDIPSCFNISSSGNMTLNIQGYLAAPSDVKLELVIWDTINISWVPPFTLDGVPIYNYTVYISNGDYNEKVNTTQSEISLVKPCRETNFSVSGWNEVGEGSTSSVITFVPEFNSPPSNVVLTNQQTKLHVTWTAPEDWQRCTTHYSIFIIDNGGAISVVNTTDATVSYSVDKPCSDAVIQVSGWSYAEGNRSSPVEFEKELTISAAYIRRIDKLSNSGICATCFFTADSEGLGCAIELESETDTHLFNTSRETMEGGGRTELSRVVLDCFLVKDSGSYKIAVYEIQCNGVLGKKRMDLGNVMLETFSNTGKNRSGDKDKHAITGLAVVFTLTLIGLVGTIIFLIIIIWKKKPFASSGTYKTASSSTSNPPENVDSPEDNAYEQVDPTAVYEKVDLQSNASYGKVHR